MRKMSDTVQYYFHLLIFSFVLATICHAQTPMATKDSLPPPTNYQIHQFLRLRLHSTIGPATVNIMQSALTKVQKSSSQALLIELNTPGGLLSSTKEILTLIAESPYPVIIWVGPEGSSATSAGAIIASAAHFLFMSEGTNIGAATPVQITGDISQKDLHSKAVNDLVGLITGLSESRGRNPLAFAEMVEKASSFNANQAMHNNLIDGMANKTSEIWPQLENKKFHLQGQEKQIQVDKNPTQLNYELDLGQRILDVLGSPQLAYILFILGAALLYIELQAPGGFIAGGIGAICLVLAGIGFQVLPLNWGAMGLIILSFVLFVLEIYITSYGLLSLAGILSLIFGGLFLFRTDESYLAFSAGIIASTTAAIAVFLAFITYFLVRSYRHRSKANLNNLVGEYATIIEGLGQLPDQRYLYNVKVKGEFWKATSHDEIQTGTIKMIQAHHHENLMLEI